ncbi:outer membrane lipoprotein carrier protein LolA [uncultured Brachyspira sp.]|uniref:LolA family protein n=1 Tax=uncultured Brachyspira sp. TaxID=221953 RepID=UPI0025931226|nr:outer membrane lipoprotein carrier protein LolA [uncultured Brachyspira sp.]
MRKIFILIYFLSSILLTAQIKSEYKNAKLLKGDYKQILYFNRNKKSFESSGEFFIAREYGICWFTKEPKKSITVMGEKNISMILPNGEKKILSDSSNAIFSQIANIIKSIFTYDEISLKDYFIESEDENKNIIYTPKNDDLKKILNKIEIEISKEGYIGRIKIFNKNGYTEYIMNVLYAGNEITDNEKKYFE